MKLLTVNQAADLLTLSPSTIRKLCWQRRLQRIYPTPGKGCVRLLESEVLGLVAGQLPDGNGTPHPPAAPVTQSKRGHGLRRKLQERA